MQSLNSFATVADAQAYFVTKKLSVNDAVNHDASFDVEPILEETFNHGSASPALKKAVRVFRKIINGVLPDIDIWDATAQAALALMVSTDDSICKYTQKMRDQIEEMGKHYPYKEVTQMELDAAKNPLEYVVCTHGDGSQQYLSTNIAKYYFEFSFSEAPPFVDIQIEHTSTPSDEDSWLTWGSEIRKRLPPKNLVSSEIDRPNSIPTGQTIRFKVKGAGLVDATVTEV